MIQPQDMTKDVQGYASEAGLTDGDPEIPEASKGRLMKISSSHFKRQHRGKNKQRVLRSKVGYQSYRSTPTTSSL